MSLNLEHITRQDSKKEGEIVTECPICLDVIQDRLITLNKCHHTFHQSCISTWFEKSNTCPICREPIQDIYKGIYLKSSCFMTKKKRTIIEFKPNKLVFYKLELQKKNTTITNTTYQNLNLETSLDRNNIITTQEQDLDLTGKNHILHFMPNEKIGGKKFQILYSDISKVSYNKKKITFYNLKVVGDNQKTRRSNKNTDTIKIQFSSTSLSNNFFQTLKKRHQYFRDTNY